MRETMKDLIKSTITSIGIALTVFCVTGMVFDIAYDGNFSLDNYQFSKMVIGCIIVGLGFGLPTMIYQKDNFHKYLPRMAAGGVTGAIMSGVLGLVGGPLLGAAGGAAIELVKNSTRLQSFLLGDEIVSKDENGNITRSRDYNSGKLPTKVSAAIDKVECPSKNGVSFNSVSRKLDINCIDEKESEHKNMLLRWTAWLFLLIFGIPITICLILELML